MKRMILTLNALRGFGPCLRWSCCLGMVSVASQVGAAEIADSTAQRAAACIACHAPQDKQVANEYFPRLAGKPALYLFNQLQNFRDGRRQHPMMMHMVSNLPDSYLQELAKYFSLQKPEYLSLVARNKGDLAQLTLGKKLVQEGDLAKKVPACIACHGANLEGRLPAIPGLLGLPQDYVNSQLGAWKNGTRKTASPDCMAQITARLTQAEMSAISNWLASQQVPANYAISGIKHEMANRHQPLPCASQEAP